MRIPGELSRPVFRFVVRPGSPKYSPTQHFLKQWGKSPKL